MLFVGFSLSDDNFHRIVDAVRRLRSSTGVRQRFGTSLALGHGGLAEVLWEHDLHRIRIEESPEGAGFPTAEAARRLEIFLDYLLSRTRDTAHLLVGERFNNILSEGERRLRDALTRFMADVSGEDAHLVRETVAWRRIERLLISLGFRPGAHGHQTERLTGPDR
jgi:hypothetical protein